MSQMFYACHFLSVYGFASDHNAGLSEAKWFPFTKMGDVLASVNTMEVFQVFVLEGGL